MDRRYQRCKELLYGVSLLEVCSVVMFYARGMPLSMCWWTACKQKYTNRAALMRTEGGHFFFQPGVLQQCLFHAWGCQRLDRVSEASPFLLWLSVLFNRSTEACLDRHANLYICGHSVGVWLLFQLHLVTFRSYLHLSQQQSIGGGGG